MSGQLDMGTPGSQEMAELVRLFETGHFAPATDLAQALIVRFPSDGFAWQALGAVFQNTCRSRDALEPLQRAVLISPTYAVALYNLGNALRALGRWEDAVGSYRQASSYQKDFVEAWSGLGNLLKEMGRAGEAEASYRCALALVPDLAEAYNNLGTIEQAAGRRQESEQACRRASPGNPGVAPEVRGEYAKAIACYRRALSLQPELAEIRNNLGLALHEQGQLETAAKCCIEALALKPDYAEAANNLGAVQLQQENLTAALVNCGRALRIDPGLDDAWNNLGNIRKDQGQLREAIADFHRAISLKPNLAAVYNNLGNVLKRQSELHQACPAYLRALTIAPDMEEAQLNLGLALLAKGELSQGWAYYEHRFFKAQGREFPYSTWSGEDLAGKRILIWGEQGIGDELLCSSMYEEVIERAAGVVIECAAKLVPLFARNFPKAKVVAKSDPPHPATGEGFDFQCASGSLARWLRPRLESFPKRDRYLAAKAERVAYWKSRLAELGDGLKVGFSWRSKIMAGDRPLYCTKLAEWGPIFAVPGVHFVNLQYDECGAELREAQERFGVKLNSFVEVDLFDDMEEASALTQALDLVITAPNVVSVMAGALGAPTWMLSYDVLLEMLGAVQSPWFARLRPMLRRWDQGWDAVIAEAADDLSKSAI